MAYILKYDFKDMELGIEETVVIQVYLNEFILEAESLVLREQLVSFLEYLEVALIDLDGDTLEGILEERFRIE